MAMDKFLAEYYGTVDTEKTAAARAEDVEKQASVDMFLKLAAQENIDLSKMAEADVQKLYDNWVKAATAPAAAPAAAAGATKTASEEEAEKKKELEEKAKKEHEEKKAQSEKVAEADFLGRVMAHAFCQEQRNILKEAAAKEAGAPAAPAAGAPRVKTAEEEKKEKEEKEKKEHEGKDKDKDKEEGGKHSMPPAFMEHLKHGSALDKLAAERAYSVASAANFDPVEAFGKVAGIINLGLMKETSEKCASAPFDQAIGIRALELLEKVGYPVTWDAK